MSAWAVLGVPIDSVGRAGGTELAPAALREAGLVERLGVPDRGDVDVRIRDEARDPETGIVGSGDVLRMTVAVRSAVRSLVAAGERPLVLGGCCALVPGALAGVRDAAGPVGIANVDGHVDVYDGRTSPTGEGADMPLAVAFGFGPERWVQAAGGPSAAPAAAVVLGARDPEEAVDVEALLEGDLADLLVLSPDDLRAQGLGESGDLAAARLAAEPGRFWIHLDVDVLDERAMPATDYLMPGGLEWEELADLLPPLCASPAVAGLSVGCLNPEKDPGGRLTARTCDLVVSALAG
ncbi:MAG TPA: arginase family protein [Gaiellaceae bacterium]|nr:arginase family protein [Gaiellaceae bacterium]HXV95760.1 arginase family protein [Gaiellaceae bacterium]